jgi:hypothetical protein
MCFISRKKEINYRGIFIGSIKGNLKCFILSCFIFIYNKYLYYKNTERAIISDDTQMTLYTADGLI